MAIKKKGKKRTKRNGYADRKQTTLATEPHTEIRKVKEWQVLDNVDWEQEPKRLHNTQKEQVHKT